MTITVPAGVVWQLREALYGLLGSIAEDLASIPRGPRADAGALAEWSEPIARLDDARAVLDALGWVEPHPEHERDIEIDLDAHRQTITDALRDELASERHLAEEEGDAAKEQREHAGQRAQVIETFAASVGLEVK
jgi:hypothetical protein